MIILTCITCCAKNYTVRSTEITMGPFKIIAFKFNALHSNLLKVHSLKSLTSEAIPSTTQFFKRLTKLAIFLDYKPPGLICLALPPRQKFGLILVIKWLKNWFYQKMPITKNVPLNLYSSMKKKLRRIRMIFDIENWLWKSIFLTLRQAGKARQSIPGCL